MGMVDWLIFRFRDLDFRGDLQTMKFGGVGHGGGPGGGSFYGLGSLYSNSSFNFCHWCQFSAQSDEIEILLGWGVGVADPLFCRSRDQIFHNQHIELV